MADKPFVQEVFRSLDSKIVKDDVESCVSKLVKKGYMVRVVLENYVTVYADKSTHMVYQTTILATAHENVDIGKNK